MDWYAPKSKRLRGQVFGFGGPESDRLNFKNGEWLHAKEAPVDSMLGNQTGNQK